MNFVQNSFSGGLDTITSDTQIAEDAYVWLINGRNRFGNITPIPKHVKLDNAPAGIKQGIRGVGDVTILFVAGKAYYQIDGQTVWSLIPGFNMDPNVDQYFTEAVPASTLNFKRAAVANISANSVKLTNFTISGTPAAIVVQDTVNQPQLIIYDYVNQLFTSRPAKTYANWQNVSATADDREYVPRGRQMMYLSGILFIVSLDGTKLYRSITGRPLDFVIVVDTNGNKLASEVQGGAEAMAVAFDFDLITCIQPVNTPDAFVYATAHNVRIIGLDFTNTIFGEPTFNRIYQISAGVVNQYSFMEIVGLGDYAFVDYEGAISFNAVQSFKFNGRNSLFSLPLAKLLNGIKQTKSICFMFNNYAIFNLDTVYGNVMAVYDTLHNQNTLSEEYNKKWASSDIQNNKWVAIDITDVINIKQVAIVETLNETKAYVITEQDEVWQLFADPVNTYPVSHRTRSHVEPETSTEHKSTYFRPFFNCPDADGTCWITEYVDNVFSQRIEQPLNSGVSGIKYPVIPPVIPSTKSQVDNPGYNLSKGLMGKKIFFVITWDRNATLQEYQFKSVTRQGATSLKQANQIQKATYGS